MRKISANYRMFPAVTVEQEWTYLTNETLEGEKCIVRQLALLLKHPTVTARKDFFADLERQNQEEISHVKSYKTLLGDQSIIGSGYKEDLNAFVESLPTVTLKLFALQGMLEGYALGALRNRLKCFLNSPGEKSDAKALYDELGHVSLAFNHFAYLQATEGIHSKSRFHEVARKVNEIMKKSFATENVRKLFNVDSDDRSENWSNSALKDFEKLSKESVVSNKNEFLNHYFLAKRA